jgi:hypothetical protein
MPVPEAQASPHCQSYGITKSNKMVINTTLNIILLIMFLEFCSCFLRKRKILRYIGRFPAI